MSGQRYVAIDREVHDRLLCDDDPWGPYPSTHHAELAARALNRTTMRTSAGARQERAK